MAYIFSDDLSCHIKPAKTWYEKLFFELFYRHEYEKINRMLVPTIDELEEAMNQISEIRSFHLESYYWIEGILYTEHLLGGIKPDALETFTPSSLSRHILIVFKHYFQSKRGIDISPFILSLTRSRLIMGFPCSRQGYGKVAELQISQNEIVKAHLEKSEKLESRKAEAFKRFKGR